MAKGLKRIVIDAWNVIEVILVFVVALLPFVFCGYLLVKALEPDASAVSPVTAGRTYYLKEYGGVYCGGAHQSECGLTLFNCTDEFVYFCVDNVRRRGDGIERTVPRP